MERQGRALVTSRPAPAQFTVVASEGLDGLPDDVGTVRIRLPRRPAFVRILWFYVRSRSIARRQRRRGMVDLVHSCGAITPARADVTTVHLCHAAVEPGLLGRRSLGRRTNARLARAVGLWAERRRYQPGRTGILVAVSDAVYAELARHYPDIERREIYNGVDGRTFDVERAGRDASSGSLGVVMVTGDFALKGVDLAVEALALAPDARLTVVGRGDSAAYLQMARRLGVDDRVVFTGQVTDVGPIYLAHDVVLCASHYESFGLFLVEGALSGCAVVANDVGVAAALVGDGTGGVIVERSAAAIGRTLSELSGDRPRVRRYGDAARVAARRFTVDNMVAEYGRLYRSAYGER
jgi:glycosyltransferase involved in cell wall biosynthesis